MKVSPISKVINNGIMEFKTSSNVIMNLSDGYLPKNCVKYGKHKVKRYLYHMTSEKNYDNMLKTGSISTTRDSYLDYSGVFMTELENLAKYWRTSKLWNQLIPENKDGIFLSLALLNQVSKDSGKVVCLRIPTKYLNHKLLMIRSQNKLCEGSLVDKVISHMETGAPANLANLYKQRKEAIEYIYQKDIPIERVELVGTSSLPSLEPRILQTLSIIEQRNIVLKTFRNLFNGQPEAKGLDAMF